MSKTLPICCGAMPRRAPSPSTTTSSSDCCIVRVCCAVRTDGATVSVAIATTDASDTGAVSTLRRPLVIRLTSIRSSRRRTINNTWRRIISRICFVLSAPAGS